MHPRLLPRCLMLIIATLSTLMMGVPQMDGADLPNRDTRPDRVNISECLADVKEVVAWDPKATQSAAKSVCKLRRQHASQKKRFASALVKLHSRYQDRTNHGFDQHIPVAQQNAQSIVKSCIDFKTGFTHPHNIGTLTVPEEIHSTCYDMGIKLVETELSR